LRLGVVEREAEASAHDTAVHHMQHPGFKLMARYTLHNTKPSRARVDMREVAQRKGGGVGKVSDANAAWGRIHVRGTPLASCGALASQAHHSSVASNDHETSPRTRREGGEKARKRCVAPARHLQGHADDTKTGQAGDSNTSAT
jgi:hypothetical protein